MAAITHSSEVPDDETPPSPDHVAGSSDAGPPGTAAGPAESGESGEQASTTSEGVRLIARFVRMHPVSFALSLVGGISWALLVVGATYVLGRITDEVIDPAFNGGVAASKVWWAVVALVLVALLRGVSVVVRRWFGSVTEARSQASLRREVSDRLLEMPMSAYRRHPTGELLANADVDITTGTQLLMPLPFSIGVIALLAVSLVSLYLSDPVFALVALVLFPLLTVLSRTYTNRVNGPASEVQARLGEVSSIAHESFDGALVVKTLGREHDEDVRFQAASDRLRTDRLVVANMSSIFQPLIDLLPNLGMIALLLAGAWRIDQGEASAGQLVQAVALFGWLAFPMRIVGFMFEAMPRSVVSVRRVDRLLAEAADPAERPDRRADSGALPEGPLSIELDGVSFSYGNTSVLDGVTFAAQAGETVALVGSTGSGKSTLTNLLVRLDVPDAGTIRVGGVPITDVDPVELRSAVSLAFQESFLFATTIAENVDLGRGVDESELYDSLDRARAARFVSALPAGGATVVGERGVTLSGGQRQRVALARSLAGRPRVLVLDDATSAVDPVIEAEILGGLRSGSTTMLVVAHRLSTILLADRVVHLEGGRVRGQGSHAELLRDPEYAALVTAYESDERTDHDACFADDELGER